MRKNKELMYLITSIVIVLFLTIFFALHFADDILGHWEVYRVRRALGIYFDAHHVYPQNLEVLMAETLLSAKPSAQIGYSVSRHGGNFTLAYRTAEGNVVCGGPSWQEITHDAKLNLLRTALGLYYDSYNQYPMYLEGEFVRDFLGEETDLGRAIDEKVFSYSVAEGLQEFSLDGKTFGPPVTWPEIRKDKRSPIKGPSVKFAQ
jgi:hypothetical protein